MSANAVEWWPTILTSLVGLGVGVFLVWRLLRSRDAVKPSKALDLRDLEARRDSLLDQLRELGDAGAKLAPEQTQAERRRLELACADALRELDRRAAQERREPVPSRVPQSGFWAERPALRGFVWGLGVVSSVGGLYLLASRSATPREGAGMAPREATAPAADDQELKALKAAVAQNPQDIEARLDLAKAHLMRHEMMEVFEQTRAVLDRDPANARALSYQALVRFAMGDSDKSLEMLRKALRTDPNLLDAWVHVIFVEAQLRRFADAERDLAEASRRHPEHAKELRSLLAELRAQPAPSPMETPAGPNPHAGLDRPAAAAADDKSVSGAIAIDPGVRVAPTAVIFVSVRAAGTAQGAPIAAKRMSPGDWPLPFTIGAADSMMGQALPARVRIDVRLDSDGDISTRDPKDPTAFADEVKLGTQGLKLTLRSR